ncbi:MAG TPA: ATP-binding protein [Smithellaceae bacterium]|nr:ATP-binding protein [Smithella sp.]HQH04065.1 ATP-binding protein [Smithellaceae bacterium]HQI73520.1 ATP-binding protein [Smithella sp.]
MTKTELLELIRNGENSGVEFKRDTLQNFDLAKELVAFSNSNGGCVLLGVDDDGSIAGLTRGDIEEWVMTTCRTKIRPEIIPFFEIIKDVDVGKDIAVVSVDVGWTVHCRWHDNHSTYYIRVGSQSREASKEELERLFQQRGAFRLEVRPVTGSSIDDLDIRRLKDYFQRVRKQDTPHDEDMSGWQQLLINTEIMTNSGEQSVCTVAGLLLFGKNPNRFIPQAGIDAVAYPGYDKEYASKERATIRGPLVGLFTDKDNQLIEPGVIEQAVYFVKRNTGVTAVLSHGTSRVEQADYPEEVIREALINAAVHRDYLLSATDIELSIYEDRLEIISPGKLPNGITPDRMRAGCRAARNQLLKDVMRDYGYLEHMGMGIPRKIIKGMQEHNGTEPDLIEDSERFTLRLWKVKK